MGRMVALSHSASSAPVLPDHHDTAPSRNAMCDDASRALGCSADTVERLLAGMTHKADARLILAALLLHECRTGHAFNIGAGIRAKLIEAVA